MDLNILQRSQLFLSEVGFEPWALNGMEGVFRRVTFRKGGLLGEVASYHSDDYIVWKHGGEADKRYILATWKPVADVMTHRFLFLDPVASGKLCTRSFFLGFKGWVELYSYKLGSELNHKKFADLIFVVNKGYELAKEEVGKTGLG